MSNNAPFRVGDEVMSTMSLTNSVGMSITKGQQFTVIGCDRCNCGIWWVDVGLIGTPGPAGNHCDCGVQFAKNDVTAYIHYEVLRLIERTRTKYVIKEVEVAPAIRELQTCQQ